MHVCLYSCSLVITTYAIVHAQGFRCKTCGDLVVRLGYKLQNVSQMFEIRSLGQNASDEVVLTYCLLDTLCPLGNDTPLLNLIVLYSIAHSKNDCRSSVKNY